MMINPGDGTGIVDEINDICNSDNNSYPLPSKARRINAALDTFFNLAHSASRPGSVDDINQTTAPIQTISVTSGTRRYALDSFTSELDAFVRFELTDDEGNETLLRRKQLQDIEGALPDYQSVDGNPSEYLIVGKYIELLPAPDFTGTLTAYFERNKVPVTAASTTTSPGIPSKFHPYICRHASLPYLVEFQKGQKNDIAKQIAEDERAILVHFVSREKGVKKRMTVANDDHR